MLITGELQLEKKPPRRQLLTFHLKDTWLQLSPEHHLFFPQGVYLALHPHLLYQCNWRSFICTNLANVLLTRSVNKIEARTFFSRFQIWVTLPLVMCFFYSVCSLPWYRLVSLALVTSFCYPQICLFNPRKTMKQYNTKKIYAPEVIHTYKKILSWDRAIQIWRLLYGELTFHA